MDRYAESGVNRGPVEETWGNFLRGSHFKSSSRQSREDKDSPLDLPVPCTFTTTWPVRRGYSKRVAVSLITHPCPIISAAASNRSKLALASNALGPVRLIWLVTSSLPVRMPLGFEDEELEVCAERVMAGAPPPRGRGRGHRRGLPISTRRAGFRLSARAYPHRARQQGLPYDLRAIARDGNAHAGLLAVRADEELHLAAVALELLHMKDVQEPTAVRAQKRPAHRSLDSREGEIDLEAPSGRVDVGEALGRLEGPDFVEPQEDERPRVLESGHN